MTAIPFLIGSDLAGLATEADAVGFLSDALRAGHVDPEADSPRLFSPAPGGEFLLMPTGGPTWSGVKLVTVAPANPARGRPKIQGVYVLFDSDDLAPVALMDAVELTLLRTPAATVLAIRHLLAAGADRGTEPLPVVVFGTGPQAHRHLRCLQAVLGPVDAVVVGRRPQLSEAFAARCSAEGLRVTAGAAAAVRDAAVVVCATSSSTPVLDDRLVPDDAVVAAVGAHGRDRAELPAELIHRSDIAVEGRAAAMRESGNLLAARTEEQWEDHPVANLADLVAGRFRRRDGHPAVYSGVGMAWQDLVVATALHDRYRTAASSTTQGAEAPAEKERRDGPR